MTKKPQSPFSMRLDPDIKDRIVKLAAKENRSLTNMAETLMKRALELAEKRK